jgi:phasin family protein
MKTNELMNAWIENSKVAMGPARELSEISQRNFARLSEHNMALSKEYMEMTTRTLQALATARDPRTLVNEQISLAKEMGDKLLSNAELYSKLASEAQEELVAWVDKSAQEAVAKAGEAAAKVG